jgi:hypothetical protein
VTFFSPDSSKIPSLPKLKPSTGNRVTSEKVATLEGSLTRARCVASSLGASREQGTAKDGSRPDRTVQRLVAVENKASQREFLRFKL